MFMQLLRGRVIKQTNKKKTLLTSYQRISISIFKYDFINTIITSFSPLILLSSFFLKSKIGAKNDKVTKLYFSLLLF